MMLWIFRILVAIPILLTTELDLPVPIPGDMRADALPFQPVTISGVRVAQRTSALSESGGHPEVSPPSSTKLHEVWAFGGYGQVSARPRIVRIKRAYKRACYRAMRQGFAKYRGGCLLPAEVPWRFRESFRKLPATRKELKPISTAPGIRCMIWNASKALAHEELLMWATAQQLDVLAIQETGWRFSATWSTPDWHCIHSACKQASVLLLVRTTIAPVDRIATATLMEGRLLHVRVFLKRTFDFFIVYQYAWNACNGSQPLLQKRLKLWYTLQACLNHIPKAHYLIVLGDFNTVLRADPSYVGFDDPRRHPNAHTDSHLLQQLLRNQDLIAINYKGGCQHTFAHGTHASRIDYILIRQPQVQFRRMQLFTNTRFERNFGINGPHHHPFLVTFPKWHAPQQVHFPLNRIDRFDMRHAFHAQLDIWVHFEDSARRLIHEMTSFPAQTAQDYMFALETKFRDLCIRHFPKRRPRRSAPSQLQSISSRMWHARREALRVQGHSLRALFWCWKHVTTYLGCQKQIRQFNRTNRRQKLETILAEGADLAFHGQTFEWYRKIRQLCPRGFVVFRCIINMACRCPPPRRYSRLNNIIPPCTQMITCRSLALTPSPKPRLIARP